MTTTLTPANSQPVRYEQLDSIEIESQHLFGDRNAVYDNIGRPSTRQAASQILIAINKLTYPATTETLKEALTDMGETIDLVEPVTTKTCSKCGEDKPGEEFHRNRNNKDGLQNWCKECTSLAYQERRNREANAAPPKSPNRPRKRRHRNRSGRLDRPTLKTTSLSPPTRSPHRPRRQYPRRRTANRPSSTRPYPRSASSPSYSEPTSKAQPTSAVRSQPKAAQSASVETPHDPELVRRR